MADYAAMDMEWYEESRIAVTNYRTGLAQRQALARPGAPMQA